MVRDLASFQHHSSEHPLLLAERFAVAVTTLECALRSTFRNPDTWAMLLTPRLFELLRSPGGTGGYGAMLAAECEYQAARIGLILDEADAISKSLASVDAVVVPDTNVLLHYKPLDNIPWCELLSVSSVRIFVPLRAVEELDALKYRGHGNTPDRARQAIRELSRHLNDARPEIRPGVTVQSEPLFDSPRASPDADAAILETCLDLASLARDVRIATGDNGIGLRAERLGLRRLLLPDDLLRTRPSTHGR
jgi:hypothetical protein